MYKRIFLNESKLTVHHLVVLSPVTVIFLLLCHGGDFSELLLLGSLESLKVFLSEWIRWFLRIGLSTLQYLVDLLFTRRYLIDDFANRPVSMIKKSHGLILVNHRIHSQVQLARAVYIGLLALVGEA